MSLWAPVVLITATAGTAVVMGALVASQLPRLALPLALGITILLDLCFCAARWNQPGVANGLVVLAAIPLSAWLATLVETRAALAAALLVASTMEVAAAFGGTLSARAEGSPPYDPARVLVLMLPARSPPMALLSVVDLALTAMCVLVARRLDAARRVFYVAGLAALLLVVFCERVLGLHLAHMPIVTGVLLLVLAWFR
ncbi:MAG: hypothetical protein U1E76_26775 [Planctomycetota bacterium]